MRVRYEYGLDLTRYHNLPHQSAVGEVTMRTPSSADKVILADLMLDSYRGTIDDEGETLQQAREEVEAYFAGLNTPNWLGCSWLWLRDRTLIAACLVSYWEQRQTPLIAYVMTALQWKGKHLGTAVLEQSLHSLARNGYLEVHAVITEGNVPSEHLFARAGFSKDRHHLTTLVLDSFSCT